MKFSISSIRHPKEKLYGSLALAAGIVIWLALFAYLVTILLSEPAVFVVFVLYGVFAWLFSLAARALVRAYILGHYVLVGPTQFPHIDKMVSEGAAALGLEEAPATFVYNSHGVMNAFAATLVGRRRYIWLTSALIDADSDEQLRFVIGHELGHHVAGHLDQPWTLLRWPGYLVPFLGAAYSRARELTCDRIGAHVAQNLNASRSALQMLACGSARLNARMNADDFQSQDSMVPAFAGFVLKIFSTYPRLTRRVEEVTRWSNEANASANLKNKLAAA